MTQSLNNILGLPVWGSKRGVGSYLYFEFGEPHLRFREPHQDSANIQEERARVDLSLRRVFLIGEWQLWVQDCEWHIESHGIAANQDDASETVDRVLHRLNGQILAEAVLNDGPRAVSHNLYFDLGGHVSLRWTPSATAEIAFQITSWQRTTTEYRINSAVTERPSSWIADKSPLDG